MMMSKKIVKKVFTLVELIITIAIIAILAILAFLRLNKRLGNARDANRSSNLASIDKSLQIYLTEKTSLPKPDNNTMIYASGTDYTIGYQGYFGENVKDTIGDIDKAPKDGENYFTYYVNNDLNKYQLMGYTENPVSYNPNIANAEDYSKKYVYVRGDKLGILTDSDKNPLQDFGGTGFNVLSGDRNYTAYYDNSTNIVLTGQSLISIMVLGNKYAAQFDTGLTGYWDMETTVLSGQILALKGLSQNGNKGSCYNSGVLGNCGSVGPSIVVGKKGKAMQFDGVDDIVIFRKRFFNMESTYTWAGRIYISSDSNPMYIYSEGHTDGTFNIQYSNTIGFTLHLRNNHVRGGYSYTGFPLSKNQWHHIVCTLQDLTDDPAVGISKYYVDGKKIFEKNVWREYDDLSKNYSAIGGNVGGFLGGSQNKVAFAGFIDEVRIYNRALSDDEVKALYLSD